MSDALLKLGLRLRQRRAEAGVDVDPLAHKAGVPAAAIKAFEAGGGGLGLSALGRLATALGVDAAAFVHTDAYEEAAPPEPAVLLSKASNASLSPEDVRRLTTAVFHARSFCQLAPILGLEVLSSRFKPMAPRKPAHRGGYALANRVRHELDAPHGPLYNLKRTIEDRFNILVLELPFDNAAIQGAACRSGTARVIALNRNLREVTARFVAGHELCHHLADLKEYEATTDSDGGESDGFNLDPSAKEQRAKAFAAMLLAPSGSVQELLGPPRADGAGLDGARKIISRARAHFGMSFASMAWHLFALKYLGSDDDIVRTLIEKADGQDVTGFETEQAEDGLSRRLRSAQEHDAISAARARELTSHHI